MTYSPDRVTAPDPDSVEIDQINLLADTWAQRVPHAEFARLRRDRPVFWHSENYPEGPDTGFWAVTKHQDIIDVSRDHATFSMELGSSFIKTQSEDNLMAMRLSILMMDPPRHDRVRKLISAGFTPRQIRGLMEKIDHHAEELVQSVAAKGQVEFVDEVSAMLPIQIICEMLGIPNKDWAQMKIWSDRLVGFDDPDLQRTPEDGNIAAAEMFMYCDALVAEKREAPTDDILSTLVHAEVEGDRLDTAELNLFFVTLVIAGNETTRNLISHGMLALLQHPDQLAKLQANIDLIPSAVDEMLRWGSSIQNFRRTATKDTVIGGQQIKAGDKVVTFYLSGNFDEEVFGDPFNFRVDRTPNDHVTFGGGGIHFCLGSHLAKAEIGAVIREIVTQLPDIHLTEEPVRLRSDFINGVKSMPVAYTPVHPA
ncbi:MAG: cholest-4-en-3-one 26-monooxygenase [Glaciecola sp.]